MAAYALDCCRNPKVVQPLLDATRDDIEPIRGQAAVSLGRIAAPAAYDRLIEKLRKGDPDESVRKMADRTIMELSRK